MREFFTALSIVMSKILAWLAGIAAVVIAFFSWLTQLVVDLTVWAYGQFQQMQAPSFEFSISDHENILGLANHFLPLAEFWAFVVVTIPYMVIVVLFRWVKQLIPTVSN